jgi:transglutaminase-like putative cysteine protease
MIAGLRGLGLAAGYVSGYLRTLPPPGKKRLQGADAMHAWVAVWCGEEHGWIEIDPTNAKLAGNDHIPLAWGRDYVDVAPVKGVIRVSGAHTLKATVDVEELEPEKPLVVPA